MAKRDIVVGGGSSGSAGPLKTLLAGLPADFPASLFVSTGRTAVPELHGRRLGGRRAYAEMLRATSIMEAPRA